MSKPQQSATQRAAHSPLRYALVGIGFVAIAWLGLSPQQPVEPKGPLADTLLQEIERAAEVAGINVITANCQAHGNLNFGVTCKVSPFDLASASGRLQSAGWQRSVLPPLAKESEHAPFVKPGVRLTLDAQPNAPLWAISTTKTN